MPLPRALTISSCSFFLICVIAITCHFLDPSGFGLAPLAMIFSMTGLFVCCAVSRRSQAAVLNRLAALTIQINQISENNYHHKVIVDGEGDEIVKLASSINHLLESFESQRVLNEIDHADSLHVQEFRNLNSELTRKAHELAAVNRELEAFNYSVSHDMRSPLRRISGYCELLLETQIMTPDVKEYLTRIYESSCWLDDMVDAMLELSQLTRADFNAERVDLSSIASELIEELMMAEPGRVVEINLQREVIAEGDFKLLKILMSNLIGNAWKYTAGREKTCIEFGVQQVDKDTVYFIRDNGIGFEMKNALKLFRVFTRLNTASQFPGNGIGLATVQRVVFRHGGRVWAEGQPGCGAAFFFTLGENSKPLPS